MRQAREDWRNHRYAEAVTGFLRREWPVIAFLICFSLIAFVVVQNRQLATSTTDALCDVRHNFEDRVEASEDFLAENPDGIPGISPETIQQGIDSQTETIAALSDLDCPPPSP